MNTALFAKSEFFGSLQSLIRRLSSSRMPSVGVTLPQRKAPNFTPKSIAANEVMTGAKGQNRKKLTALRVVRVVETGQSRASVGRMVISGRMADVCAELDRLAAREAALS